MAEVRCQETSGGEANNSSVARSFVFSVVPVPMNCARLHIEDEY